MSAELVEVQVARSKAARNMVGTRSMSPHRSEIVGADIDTAATTPPPLQLSASHAAQHENARRGSVRYFRFSAERAWLLGVRRFRASSAAYQPPATAFGEIWAERWRGRVAIRAPGVFSCFPAH